jgi:hypothetical protein
MMTQWIALNVGRGIVLTNGRRCNMTKANIVGFNQGVADQDTINKKDKQRKQVAAFNCRHIHFTNDSSNLRHRPFAHALRGIRS